MAVIMIRWVRYLLCLISMILTGLFALNFSATTTLPLPFVSDEKKLLAPILMVSVGMSIDLSKYLFWQYRRHSRGFLLISLLLVFFSWAASVAFFLSQEQGNLATTRRETSAYKAHRQKIQHLQLTIDEQRQLLNKRLSSRFHAQWNQAAELMEDINALEQQLAVLAVEQESIGLREAQQKLSTAAFFVSLAQSFKVSVSTVTLTAYSVLALLIELCALGAISLAQGVKDTPAKRELRTGKEAEEPSLICSNTTHSQKSQPIRTSTPKDIDKKQLLRQDILAGIAAPVLRQLKRARYGLSEDKIRGVLQELKTEGLLIQRGRRFSLANRIKAE